MIDIIPKEPVKYPFGIHLLLYIGIAIFGVSIVGFFVLQQLTLIKTEEIVSIEEALLKEIKPEEQALEEKMVLTKRKIDDFSHILAVRRNILNFFALLEKDTHPAVVFRSLNLDAQEYTAVLSGESTNFFTLEQQMLVFQNEVKIEEINLVGARFGQRNTAVFELNMQLDPELFQ
ncbi:hypothetical protein IID24_03485 [Patescibacteria group bacterium]|nr:hypothetical protein [Patescibacteria group bacterium]